MTGPLRSVARLLLLAAAIALTSLPAACGVDFDPDKFCWKCTEDSDCGAEYACRVEGKIGRCVPADLSEDERTPCDPPPAADDE